MSEYKQPLEPTFEAAVKLAKEIEAIYDGQEPELEAYPRSADGPARAFMVDIAFRNMGATSFVFSVWANAHLEYVKKHIDAILAARKEEFNPTEKSMLEAAEKMNGMGGSFARTIAAAWSRADSGNRRRLELAFEELFKRYGATEAK